jgi:hypothetical protein
MEREVFTATVLAYLMDCIDNGENEFPEAEYLTRSYFGLNDREWNEVKALYDAMGV